MSTVSYNSIDWEVEQLTQDQVFLFLSLGILTKEQFDEWFDAQQFSAYQDGMEEIHS